MVLKALPVAFVFLDVTSIELARHLFENIFGFRIIENQFHPPHHHHGIFKYDAGNVILALNMARPDRFDSAGDDGIITEIAVPDVEATIRLAEESGIRCCTDNKLLLDSDNHRYRLVATRTSEPSPSIREIALEVDDLHESRHFYRDKLRLAVNDAGDRLICTTGGIPLSLAARRPEDRPLRHNGYLSVFYTDHIRATAAKFIRQGIEMRGEPCFTRIGGTVRFIDPTGHEFCLYQPAEECFGWGSGAKLSAIVGRARILAEAG